MGNPRPDNHAKSYMCWNDGTPYEVPAPSLTSGSIIAASSALKSSVNVMLILYDSFLEAVEHQKKSDATSSPNNPFKQTKTTLAPHIQKNATSYGLGWFLTELFIRLLSYLPIRFLFLMCLTGLAGSCWILSSVLAKEARATALAKPAETAALMEKEQEKGTPVRPLCEYTGRYYNNIGNIFLEVTIQGDSLRLCVQGFDNTCYDLYHYHHDTFAWACSREAEVKKVMFPTWYDGIHKFHFASGSANSINRIIWKYGRDVPAPGETFMKSHDAQLFCLFCR